MDYKSQHSGHAIDKAVTDIQSVDLQKLNHYLGIFSDLGTRPVRGKQAGDYCYVGVSTDCDEHHWNGHAWTIAQTHLNLVGEVNNIVQELGDNPRVAISQMAISQIIRDIVSVDDEQTRNIVDNAKAIADLQKIAEALNTLTAEHSNTISEHSNTLANHQAELDDHSQVLENHQTELANHAESISSLNDDIGRIDNTDKEQQEQIGSNTTRITAVENRSSALEQQTTELNARTSELESKSLRYKGVFADASLLPTDAMAGDYAYVGTDTTALAVYTFGAAWAATGEIVDLATVSNLDNIMPAEPSEHRAPTTALLASALATQKAEQDAKLTELESKTSLSALTGIEGKVAMNINDRLVFFDLTLTEGDVLIWSASDSEGSEMIVSLFYGDDPADYIVLDKSPYIVDNAHKYTRLRFWRNAATISEVSYYFKLVSSDSVSKEDISGEKLLSFPNNTLIQNGDVTPNDTNWISTDFISLEGILSFSYYLASMRTSAAISFYTDKDYATQITSANIMGTTNIGISGIMQGTIPKELFPTNAKYVVFCSVNPASIYYDGDISAVAKFNQILYNTAKIEEIMADSQQKGSATNVLYSKNFRKSKNYDAWVGVSADKISNNGLQVDTNGCVLYIEYGLAQRILNLLCKFNSDSIVQITSYPTKDSALVINCVNKTFNLNGLHEVSMPFFNAGHDYNIEIVRDYQSMKVRLTDMLSGDEAEYDYINNGTGGVGGGAVGAAYLTGAFHDFYQFGTTQGTFYIKDVKIMAFATNYNAIFYGDSITEQDSYFPTSELGKSWVFRALADMKGVASGRGGGNITGVMSRIKNELPFINAKYVVVTIGTNGYNTIDRLSELVEYIQSQGATPILNHIPCNESRTQVEVNAMIDEIRAKYGIKGANFDLCTSINGDGLNVNEDLMFWENYSSSNNIYHHPNEKGGATMYCQLRQDVPEIFL